MIRFAAALTLLSSAAIAQVQLIPAEPAGTLFDLVPVAEHARLEVDVAVDAGATTLTLTTAPVRGEGSLLTWTAATSQSQMIGAPWAAPLFLPAAGNAPQTFSATLPSNFAFDDNLSLYLRNLLVEDGAVVGTNVVEVPLGPPGCIEADLNAHPAGTIVSGQFAGVSISADSNNPSGPDAAILFDSSAPTGEDGDLVTPGYGPGNTVARQNVLVIAEDVIDLLGGDGLVDDPDDEGWGGSIRFDFEEPAGEFDFTLLDIDTTETLSISGTDTDGFEFAFTDIAGTGDNSSLTFTLVALPTAGIVDVEIAISGSGAISRFSHCPFEGTD